MPAMQLLILPPAFGLPSIDAECSAAVALLQLLARDRYELVATYENADQLPCLLDGSSRITGLNAIVHHLTNKHVFDRTSDLNPRQVADSVAIAAFLEANAPTLLDISLYVSFENYRHTTRPAFTRILPWHANYIIPPQRRNAARARTEHLGISSIDVDNVHEDMSNRPPGFDGVGKEPQFEAETQKRASLLLPRKETVRSLLQRPEHAAVFRLHAIADAFFEPLEDMLGEHEFLLHSNRPHPVDCLLYGYLSLMLYPSVPQDWLASTMRRKYKNLVAFTERLHALLNLSTDVESVSVLAKCNSPESILEARRTLNLRLPWVTPATSTSTSASTLSSIVQGVLDQLPLLGPSSALIVQHTTQRPLFERYLSTSLISIAAGCATLGYLTFRVGWLDWPHGEETHIFGRKRFADYGYLGAALTGLNLYDSTAQSR